MKELIRNVDGCEVITWGKHIQCGLICAEAGTNGKSLKDGELSDNNGAKTFIQIGNLGGNMEFRTDENHILNIKLVGDIELESIKKAFKFIYEILSIQSDR